MSDDQDYGSGEGGKRSAEDQRQNQNKRPRGDFNQVVFRLMIRSINAGGVIGKGGENIKRLRSDYEAKVTIPDCNGPERIIKIVTKNLDSALDCIKDIIPSVGEKKHSQDQNKQNNFFIRIMVHQSHAGAIIGRSGFKIQELREKTGAHFKVYTETCPKSTDRVVQLTGNPDVITKAAREVYEICSETAVKGPVQDYDPFCHDLGFYDRYGGYLFDSEEEGHGGDRGGYGGERGGGQWNRGPPMGRGGRGGFDRNMGGGNDNYGYGRSPYGGGGGGGGGHMGGGGGGGGMGMRGGRGGRGRGGRGGMGGRGGFGRDHHFSGHGFDFGGDSGRHSFGGGQAGDGGFEGSAGGSGGGEAVQTQQVTIPNDLAGSIIGKGGQRIKRIRTQCGAQIKIDDPLQGAKERIITITGTQHCIAHAKYLLQSSVKEYQSSGGGNQ